MNRLRKQPLLFGTIFLLLVTAFLASCKSDDPVAPVVTNRAPGVVTIDSAAGTPVDGAVAAATTVTLHWNCTDADGDVLTYSVHWGNADTPPVVSVDQAGNSWGPASLAYNTTFYWQIEAKDPDGETSVSPVWSFTTLASPTETISDPNTPTGPTTGEVGTTLQFSASGSVSSLGHSIEYRLDWDDGTTSDWGANQDVGHTWAAAGTYEVTALARCMTHPTVISASSPARSVTITAVAGETISTPNAPVGPTTGEIYESLGYEMTGAVSSYGSALHAQFDWGDGTTPTWTAVTANKIWLTAGVYDVSVRARSASDQTIVSAWSPITTVTITTSVETITVPSMSGSSDDLAGVNDDAWVSCNYATSNLGHNLEYRFDLGDGTETPWSTNNYGYFQWSTAGTYTIRAQARCAEHTTVMSDWSVGDQTEEIVISAATETISTPVIQDPGDARINTLRSYSASAASSLGHSLEYKFEWDDGTVSNWRGNVGTHTYTTLGDYSLRVMARCITHPDIESEWSAVTLVHVVEQVSQPTLEGPATGIEDIPVTFTASGSTSELGHDLEYRLYISSLNYDVGTPQAWTSIDNLIYTFPLTGGTLAHHYYVRVQARCIEHETESILSLPVEIVISVP